MPQEPKKLKKIEEKEQKLTEKQERFCREYVVCMNASEAYRRSYNAENMKPETIWKRACELLAGGHVKGRIEELKKDIENVLQFNKLTIIRDLQEIVGRSLHGKAKMVWDPDEKRLVPLEDKQGNTVYEFDSAGANKAIEQIIKAMGYNEPEKKDITSNGETIKINVE